METKPEGLMPPALEEKREFHLKREKIVSMVVQSLVILVLASALAVGVNLWRPAGLSFRHQGISPGARVDTIPGQGAWISVENAEKHFAMKKAVFIDARPSSLYEQSHITGSRSLPVEQFDEFFTHNMADVPQDHVLVVYCDGKAAERSTALAQALIQRGYTNVRVLEKGLDLWVAHELPLEAGNAIRLKIDY